MISGKSIVIIVLFLLVIAILSVSSYAFATKCDDDEGGSIVLGEDVPPLAVDSCYRWQDMGTANPSFNLVAKVKTKTDSIATVEVLDGWVNGGRPSHQTLTFKSYGSDTSGHWQMQGNFDYCNAAGGKSTGKCITSKGSYSGKDIWVKKSDNHLCVKQGWVYACSHKFSEVDCTMAEPCSCA